VPGSAGPTAGEPPSGRLAPPAYPPGKNGTIYAESCCVGSTESNRATNTARIVFTGGAGGGPAPAAQNGGSTGNAENGGSLPHHRFALALVAGIGGAVVVIGIVLMFVFRRRRVVTETPND
jgi:hypothetical protein